MGVTAVSFTRPAIAGYKKTIAAITQATCSTAG
jgi:hypothetical protein